MWIYIKKRKYAYKCGYVDQWSLHLYCVMVTYHIVALYSSLYLRFISKTYICSFDLIKNKIKTVFTKLEIIFLKLLEYIFETLIRMSRSD